jgi:hypothetical protein
MEPTLIYLVTTFTSEHNRGGAMRRLYHVCTCFFEERFTFDALGIWDCFV